MCASGRADCGGSCVDTTTNDMHCGACGNACAASEACMSDEDEKAELERLRAENARLKQRGSRPVSMKVSEKEISARYSSQLKRIKSAAAF